ncbi:MAG TPA: fic family toxin-antitoxin system, toxin component, partial [Streptomyces sp.]|nr:fic family toxin-antitoxin system, toxin component [Streptomyces sp.]
ARVPVKPGREDAVALKDLLLDPACTAGNIAALLRTWPTVT